MRRWFILILGGLVFAQPGGDRRALLAKLELVMGPLPQRTDPALSIAALEQHDEGTYVRKKITYVSEPADRVPAWLLIPKHRRGRLPAIVCLHQTTRIGKDEPVGMGPKPNLHYAKELAQRGYVAIAPDYPNFGDYKFDPYANGYASATMKGIWNHMRAVDVLRSMREVDGKRIAAIGHSLGGHNALFLAAFEPRIRAVVTSCGFTSFAKYYGGDLTGWSHKGYMPRIADIYRKDPRLMPFDFTDVLSAIAPRAVFINAPLHDSNFEVSGVKDVVAAVEQRFPTGRLVAVYPDTTHDFPPEVREQAYGFLERSLR